MQRMRTITKAYQYLKEQDPETDLTKTAFRTFINEGYIPSIHVGCKTLVNLDNVDKFLQEGVTEHVTPTAGIRAVPMKIKEDLKNAKTKESTKFS